MGCISNYSISARWKYFSERASHSQLCDLLSGVITKWQGVWTNCTSESQREVHIQVKRKIVSRTQFAVYRAVMWTNIDLFCLTFGSVYQFLILVELFRTSCSSSRAERCVSKNSVQLQTIFRRLKSAQKNSTESKLLLPLLQHNTSFEQQTKTRGLVLPVPSSTSSWYLQKGIVAVGSLGLLGSLLITSWRSSVAVSWVPCLSVCRRTWLLKVLDSPGRRRRNIN